MEIVRAMQNVRRLLDHLALPVGAIGSASIALRLWRGRGPLSPRVGRNGGLRHYGDWSGQPLVSVLVAAWNESGRVVAHIDSFLGLSYPRRELVICAGGDDRTYELAARLAGPQVRVLRQLPGEGKQRALRRCFEAAAGEVLLLTDADCLLADDAFERLVGPVAEGRYPVTSGASQPLPDQRGIPLVEYQHLIDLAWFMTRPEIVDGVLGRNCALTRAALEAVGGFAAPVHTGTDYDLSRRLVQAALPIGSIPASSVATEFPSTAAAYLRMWRRWNKNLLVHGARFGAWADVRGVVLAGALYVASIAGIVLAPFVGRMGPTAGALVMGAALTGRLQRLRAGARLSGVPVPPDLLMRTPAYTLLDMVAVLLALYDAAHPHLRDRW